MPNRLPDLAIPQIPTGTHGTPWDLGVLLYRGGAGTNRKIVGERVASGELGALLKDRLPLVVRLHDAIQARVAGGEAFGTTHLALVRLFSFVAWVDKRDVELKQANARDRFLDWAEFLGHRARIKKDLSESTAYGNAVHVAGILAAALGISNGDEPGRSLMKHTRLRAPGRKKGVLGVAADKQKLDEVFEFGRLMTAASNSLSASAIRGALPINVELRNGSRISIKGYLHVASLEDVKTSHKRAARLREPLPDGESALERRPNLVNLRIEVELHIFIAQTGMNLRQATLLRRSEYRWQSDGDELNAFRVHKDRRAGEAIFRCFKAYRDHLKKYLAWLDEIGLSAEDDRIFPFVYHRSAIPPEHHFPVMMATTALCKLAGIKHIKPRALRKARTNWLLRRSKDPDQTAEQMAHAKETLLRDYEEPHYQSAVSEIVRYHKRSDPTIAPPGPGVCVSVKGRPEAIDHMPSQAPRPDCISPDGCLFCKHHRDVMNSEYCWKLTSHSRLKLLESALVKPARTQTTLPTDVILERIESKLRAIGAGSQVRATWVRDARDKTRSGQYHPLWDTQIELLETLNDPGL